MTPPEFSFCQDHTQMLSQIPQIAPRDRFGMLKIIEMPPEPWQLISSDTFKLILTCGDYFLKIYAPICQQKVNYATSAYETLRDLSTLELECPVLPPLALCENVLIFPRGEKTSAIMFSDIPEKDRVQIQTVVVAHQLLTLGEAHGSIDIVTVQGKEYLVDPFDDSTVGIFGGIS